MIEQNRKIKVALVTPSVKSDVISCSIPLNLGYLASYLLKVFGDKIEIKIFDGRIINIEESLFEFNPSIVGITASTLQAVRAYDLATKIRNCSPDVFTVMGGCHASALPNEASKYFDCVVVGEGEHILTDIISKLQNKQHISNIVYGEEEDLDSLPMPAYHLFNMKNYLSYSWPFLCSPVATLITSRGCPYKCVFCYNSGRSSKVRYESAEKVVGEILFLHNNYGVSNFWFEDDEFLINVKRLKEIKSLLEQKNISWFKWGCQARSTTLTVPLLSLAKSMGCKVIFCGMESGCEETLQYLKVGTLKVSDNIMAMQNAKQVGVPLAGFFIIGSPKETFEQIKETRKFILDSDLVSFGINICTPYPGTKLWKDCEDLKLIPPNVNYEDLNALSYDCKYMITRIPNKQFKQFLVDLGRTARLISLMNQGIGLKLFRAKGFWYSLAFHPVTVIKHLPNTFRSKVR